MTNKDGLVLIDKILGDLDKSGDMTSIVADLKQLREVAKEEKDPTLVKTLRLTYEHLENVGTFEIETPIEEAEEGEEVTAEVETETGIASLTYLISIMKNAQNKFNREELMYYRDILLAEAE